MSPFEMHAHEVQHYASPVLVKNRQYLATLTSERLIIEGGSSDREFRISSILSARPCDLGNHEPGLMLVISTPSGQKEMIWGFPVGDVFKTGEQGAWIEHIGEVIGDKPFAVPGDGRAAPARSAEPVREIKVSRPPEVSENMARPEFIAGESVIIETAGVRVKQTFYTLYLTNVRLIMQNNTGKIGREFAIAELRDAAEFVSEGGEPSIAISVGFQSGAKQMVLSFPKESARDAWMRELRAVLPVRMPLISAAPEQAIVTCAGNFVPDAGERLLVSTEGVRIKRTFVTLHLTGTRFVIEGKTGILGEFAISTLKRANRLAGEVGEPGIALLIGGRDGEKEMHLLFPSMPDRERWIGKLGEVLPEEQTPVYVPETNKYTVTTVTPPSLRNTQDKYCHACGARNHVDAENCALCGTPFGGGLVPSDEHSGRSARREKRERPEKRAKSPYNGGVIGFVTRPSDAFSYYMRETPRDAVGMFLLSGALWAVISVLLIAYVVPVVLKLSLENFPLFMSLQSNLLLLVFFVLILYVIWLVCVMMRAVITGIVARVCEPEVKFSEIMAIVMRSSLSYAVIGWIPIIGMFAASIWSAVVTWKGLVVGQNMRAGQAAVSALLGLVLIYVLLFAAGSI